MSFTGMIECIVLSLGYYIFISHYRLHSYYLGAPAIFSFRQNTLLLFTLLTATQLEASRVDLEVGGGGGGGSRTTHFQF